MITKKRLSKKTAANAIANRLRMGMAFRLILQSLHSQEVLTEEAIIHWGKERQEDADDDPRNMKSIQQFLEWLEQESEDEDDDDSDDSDDE